MIGSLHNTAFFALFLTPGLLSTQLLSGVNQERPNTTFLLLFSPTEPASKQLVGRILIVGAVPGMEMFRLRTWNCTEPHWRELPII